MVHRVAFQFSAGALLGLFDVVLLPAQPPKRSQLLGELQHLPSQILWPTNQYRGFGLNLRRMRPYILGRREEIQFLLRQVSD
jgi:hypothetical protein